jgi:hypothetical protein
LELDIASEAESESRFIWFMDQRESERASKVFQHSDVFLYDHPSAGHGRKIV